jgi:hypothetical protein
MRMRIKLKSCGI